MKIKIEMFGLTLKIDGEGCWFLKVGYHPLTGSVENNGNLLQRDGFGGKSLIRDDFYGKSIKKDGISGKYL